MLLLRMLRTHIIDLLYSTEQLPNTKHSVNINIIHTLALWYGPTGGDIEHLIVTRLVPDHHRPEPWTH